MVQTSRGPESTLTLNRVRRVRPHSRDLYPERLPPSIREGASEYTQLIAAIIRSGLEEEGPDYLRTAGGRFWCWHGGVEPEVAWAKAKSWLPSRATAEVGLDASAGR